MISANSVRLSQHCIKGTVHGECHQITNIVAEESKALQLHIQTQRLSSSPTRYQVFTCLFCDFSPSLYILKSLKGSVGWFRGFCAAFALGSPHATPPPSCRTSPPEIARQVSCQQLPFVKLKILTIVASFGTQTY